MRARRKSIGYIKSMFLMHINTIVVGDNQRFLFVKYWKKKYMQFIFPISNQRHRPIGLKRHNHLIVINHHLFAWYLWPASKNV